MIPSLLNIAINAQGLSGIVIDAHPMIGKLTPKLASINTQNHIWHPIYDR